MTQSNKVKGAKARANKLSKEERSEIARKAARMRWNEDIPQAICGATDKPLRIADKALECYVLDDGTRLLTQAGFLQAIGRHRKARVRYNNQEDRVPAIIQGKAIGQFVTGEILEKTRPVMFRTPSGSRAYGYRAELLPLICDIYLRAREEGVLPPNQQHVAKQAEILVRGLAHVGIIALVDEATGYQEFRARDALSRILEAFIAKELQPWVKTFPDDFYRQLFRLRGLNYPEDPVKRPQYFGILTNDMIYKRLAPGVLDELKRITTKDENGRSRHRYFQRLTSNIGYPKLREHLGSIVAIMKLSDEWREFMGRLDYIHPRFNSQLPLILQYDAEHDDGNGI